MFAKGLSNQSGTVYSRPFGCSIRRPKQLRIQHYLNGFHTVENIHRLTNSQPIRIRVLPAVASWRRGRKGVLARLTFGSALSLRKSWSLLPPQKVGVLRRSAKRSSKLVLLHATRKELNTLVGSWLRDAPPRDR